MIGAHSWLDANQAVLMAELAVLRLNLQARLDRAEASPAHSPAPSPAPSPALDEALATLVSARERLPAPSALDQLSFALGLSPFERGVLLLAAAADFDARWPALFARAHGDPANRRVSYSLALGLLADPHWSALAPDAPLRRWQLLEMGSGTLTQAPLSADERVLHHLAGLDVLDARLAPLLRSTEPALHCSVAETAVQRLGALLGSGASMVQLAGRDHAARALATEVAGRLRCNLRLLAAADLPAQPADAALLARLWEREARLTGRLLLIDGIDRPELALRAARFAERLNERLDSSLLIAATEPLTLSRPAAVIELPPPDRQEQRQLWTLALGPSAARLNGQLDQLASQFTLNAAQIQACAAEADGQPDSDPLAERVWDACRRRARVRLDELATRLDTRADWEMLVLPSAQKQVLADIVAQLRGRARVYDDWGFAQTGSGGGGRGLGLSALFAGPSGTGKTLAAEVIANTLRLDLYRIDLSQVVSKYIGETEKNLRRVFDAAEDSGAILLFDEADALFGKRSEVRDSHDRYANVEISYLLQRMEAYRGLAILTTNLKNALDKAFLRRIRFVVQFPFPDAATRAEIWRRVFPAATPLHNFAPERLARLELAGGNIRNIALNAAFYAADGGHAVGPEQLLRAARAEFAKLERPMNLTEGDWA